MIRKLIDYKKLDHDLTAKLIQTYSDGYGDEDIITFKNVRGEIIETVELKTEDAVYLVKISKSLASFISNFDETMEKELETKEGPIVEDEMGANEMRLQSEEELSEDI